MKIYCHKIFLSLILLSGMISAKGQSLELSLHQALQQAKKGNREVQVKWLEFRQSESALREMKSYRLPVVAANALYSVNMERPVIYLRNELASPKLDDVRYGGRYAFLAGIDAGYSLIDAQVKSNIRIAKLDQELKREAIKSKEEELAWEVSRLYLEILLNSEQRKSIAHSLRRNELALQDSRLLFLQGKNLKSDTLSNYIDVQDLRVSLSGLDNNMLVLSQQLKQVLGLSPQTALALTDSLYQSGWEFSMPGQEADISRLLSGRTDLSTQQLQLSRSKEALLQVKAAFKPRLNAIASYQLQSQADDWKLRNYTFPRSSFAGLAFEIPIYSGKRLLHKSRQSALSIQQNELLLAELEAAATTEWITLNARLRQAYDQWQMQIQNVEAAQVNYEMAHDRYRHGLGTRLELSDAELALTKNKLGIVQSVFKIRLIQLQLKKASGQLTLNGIPENN